MARPKKQTVDYFPHDCDHKKTMFVLEQKYGNDGYAFWFKLLEMLGRAEGHCINLNDATEWEFLTSKTRVTDSICGEILDLLARLDAIDRELWESRVIWCQNFVDRIRDAYRNRTSEIPVRPDFLRKKPLETPISDTINPQTKLNKTKVKKEYCPNSQELQISELLFSLIQARDPKAKKPDFQKWAKHIDLLIRLDKRDPDEIRKVIEWSQQSDFWKNNILSTEKLRKQFTQLKLKMDEETPWYAQNSK